MCVCVFVCMCVCVCVCVFVCVCVCVYVCERRPKAARGIQSLINGHIKHFINL